MKVHLKPPKTIVDLPWFEVADRMLSARAMAAENRLNLLVGEPGIGKTTYAHAAALRFTGRAPQVLYGSPETEERHIYGYFSLTGDSTCFVDGPLMRALKTRSWLLVEEFSQIPLEHRIAFLGLRGQAHLDNPITGEVVPIPPEFRLLATSNLESLACRRNATIARVLYDGFLILDVPSPTPAQVEELLRQHFPKADDGRIQLVLKLWEEYREIAEKKGDEEAEHVLSFRAAAQLMSLLEAGMDLRTATRVALVNKYVIDPDLYTTAKLKGTIA